MQVIRRFYFFLLLVFMVGFGILFKNEVLFTGDNFDLLFPQKYFLKQEISAGRIPLWNPYILSGTPYLADINLGTFSPFNIIYFIFSDIETAGSLIFLLSLFIIGYFTYLLAKFYNISTSGSYVSAVSFMLGGITLAYYANLSLLTVTAFLPPIIFFLSKALNFRNFKLFIFSSILYALQIFSGHIQITFYTGIIVALLIISSQKLKLMNKIKLILIFFIASFSLSAIQLFPFIEFIKYTPRFNQSYQWATFGSLAFFDLVKVILPKFAWNFVNWVDFSQKINFGYIGVIPLILALTAIYKIRDKMRFWKFTSIIFLIISLGNKTPFYKILYFLIPGFSSLRLPAQAFSITAFSLCLLSGAGFDFIMRLSKSDKYKHTLKTLLILFSLFLFILVWIIQIFANFNFFVNIFTNLFAEIYSYQLLYKMIIWVISIFLFILLATVFFISLFFLKIGKKKLASILILGFITIDLFLTAKTAVLTAPLVKISDKSNSIIDYDFSDNYKIYTMPPVQIPDKVSFSPEVEIDFALEKRKLLLPNQNILGKFYSLDGYSSMAISNYLNLFSDSSKTITGLGKLNIKDVDFAKHGVKYIISKEEINSLEKPEFVSDNFFVYEVENARSRHYLENGGLVEILIQNSIEIVLKITTDKEDNKLIFLDNNYPGWEVYIDGIKNKVGSFEKVYKSVLVPSGNHLVKFKFSPYSYKIGKIISLISFLIMFLILITKRKIDLFK